MAETIRGVGVVWGLGSDFSATGTGVGTFLPQGADFEVEADEVEIPDYKGETIGEIYLNEKNTLKMEVIPKGTTLALARAANVLPSPGAVITVVDTNDAEIAGATTTAYLFIRGSKRKSVKDVVKLNFELKRYVANDVTATVAAS
jgi:hypothetical protein